MMLNSVKKYAVILLIITNTITHTIVCEEIVPNDVYVNQDLDDICSHTDNFDSIFMLRGQTFLKIGHKIWRLNVTDIDKLTGAEHLVTDWGETTRVREMEKTLNNFQIDLTRSIFAFDYQFEYRTNSCDLSQRKRKQNECKIYKPGGMASFVCIYGFHIRNRGIVSKSNAQDSWAFSYDSDNFTEIQTLDLKKQVHHFCHFQLDYMVNKSNMAKDRQNAQEHACQPVIRTGWSQMNTDKDNPYLKLYYQCIKTDNQMDFLVYVQFSLKTIDEIEYQFENCEQTRVGYLRNKTMNNGLYVPIGFNGGYYIFECESKECHVWSQLKYSHNYENLKEGIPEVVITNTNHLKLSIDFFLQCQQHFQRSKRFQKPALITSDNYLDDPDSICSQKDKIDSVFMLLGHTFFKVNGRIWRLNATRNQNPYQSSSVNWKTTTRVRDIEKILNNDSIDLRKTIFAFDYQFEYKGVCSDNNTDQYNECQNTKPFDSISFVCLYESIDKYQTSNNAVRSYTYDSERLSHIKDQSLRDQVLNFCFSQLKYMYNYPTNNCTDIRIGWSETKSNIGWFTDTYPHLHIYYTCVTQPSNMMLADKIFYLDFDLRIPGNLDLNISSFKQSSHKYSQTRYLSNRIFVPIAFKDGYYILSCFLDNCHVWDKMYLVIQLQHHISETKYPLELAQLVHYNGLEMSLKEILRCPLRHNQRQNSNQFCENQSFDSIFNLGQDIYFQSGGRFWRYDSKGSNEVKGVKLANNYKNVQFESSMSALMDKYFDIRQRITGFSIKVCLDNDLINCTNSTDLTDRELACIYGTDRYSSFIYKMFIKSESGLKEFQYENLFTNDSVLTICEKVYQPFKMNTSMRMLSVFLHKKVVLDDFISYYLDNTVNWLGQYDYNHLNSPWLGYQGGYLLIDKSRTKIIGLYQSQFWDRSQTSFDGLFHYGSEYVMFSYNRTNWKINMTFLLHRTKNYSDILKLGSVNTWRINLFDYFNCTANSSVSPEIPISLPLIEMKDPYEWNGSPLEQQNETLSAFNIGQSVYFQMGQQFYRYIRVFDIRFESGFIYDKQVTELLTGIFDTTERVIGYSYNDFDKIESKQSNRAHEYYTVVLIGKPKLRSSGELSSKLIAKIFEMRIHPTPQLTQIDQEQNQVEN